MVAFIGFIILLITTTIHIAVDKRLWGIRTTPGVLLISGYTFIAGIFLVSTFFYKPKAIEFQAYLFVSIFGWMSMFISITVCYALSWRKALLNRPQKLSGRGLRNLLLMTIITYITLAVPAALNNGGLLSSESKESLAKGLIGHLHVLLSFLLIYYAVSTQDKWPIKPLIYIISVITLAINPVKGWLLIPVFSVVIAETMKKNKHEQQINNILPFFVLGFTGIIFFFSIYLSRQLESNFSHEELLQQIEWTTAHFLFYLTGGFVGFNGVLNGVNLNGGPSMLFVPLVNLYAFFHEKDYISPISDIWINGYDDLEWGTNVYSMLGSLVGYAGLLKGTGIGLFWIGMIYISLALSYRLNSLALRAGSVYMSSILGFAWFEYYFWHLGPYEIFCLTLIAFFLEKKL